MKAGHAHVIFSHSMLELAGAGELGTKTSGLTEMDSSVIDITLGYSRGIKLTD